MNDKISITDRFIYNYIDSFSRNDKDFFGSNQNIAKEINKSTSVVSHSIGRLLKLGYLVNNGSKMYRLLRTTEKKLLSTNYNKEIAENDKEIAKNDKELANFNKELAENSKEIADFNQLLAENSISLAEFKREFAKNSNNQMLKSAIASAENSNILLSILISYTNNIQNDVKRNNPINNINQEDFERFWKEYPRKIGKAQCMKSYEKAIKETNIDIILTGLKKYSLWLEKNKTEEQFIKHPSTWLNQKCYLDDYGFNNITLAPNRQLHGFEKLAMRENRELSKLEKIVVEQWLEEEGLI